MIQIKKLLTAGIFLFYELYSGCSGPHTNAEELVPYLLTEPGEVQQLDMELIEISGLDAVNNDTLVSVQDEDGFIYLLSSSDGSVINKISFTDPGDYEGIAVVEKDVFVLKSNGNLYKVKNFLEKEDPKITEYRTRLSSKNDAEGFCYDKKNSQLLIACKAEPIKNQPGKKAIYAFNLEDKIFVPDPVILLDQKEIERFLIQDDYTEISLKLREILSTDEDNDTFMPSGMAIHPFTGDYYVLSARNSLMIVLDSLKNLKLVHAFNSRLFPQPEGITFTPNGDLYISNEGDGRRGNLIRFPYQDPLRDK